MENMNDEEKNYISIEDFQKLDLRVAVVENASRVKDSTKLLDLSIDISGEKRKILAGIGEYYEPEYLIGKKIVVVYNLNPKKIMGMLSEGMLLAASSKNKISLLTVDRDIESGSKIG